MPTVEPNDPRSRAKFAPPGPGNYVSNPKTKQWEPAMIMKTHIIRVTDPNERDRFVDEADKDENGKPIWIPDPAAKESIEKEFGPGATGKPVVPFPDPAPPRVTVVGAAEASPNVAALQSELAETKAALAEIKGMLLKRGPGRPPKEKAE